MTDPDIDRNRLALELDDVALMRTGRSLGILGSANVVDDLLDADGGYFATLLAERDEAVRQVAAVRALLDVPGLSDRLADIRRALGDQP